MIGIDGNTGQRLIRGIVVYGTCDGSLTVAKCEHHAKSQRSKDSGHKLDLRSHRNELFTVERISSVLLTSIIRIIKFAIQKKIDLIILMGTAPF